MPVCEDCGKGFSSDSALRQHRATVHAGREYQCRLCGKEFDSPQALDQHHGTVHAEFFGAEPEYGQAEYGEAEYDDEPTRWWHWILAVPLMLWELRYFLGGAFVVVAIVLGLLGVFDKESAKESKSCPGYSFVRKLKAKDQINTFRSVEADSGWDCEYSLDNDDATVRFRTQGGKEQMEGEGYSSSSAYRSASREARAQGYSVR